MGVLGSFIAAVRRAATMVSVPTLLVGMLVGALCAGGGAVAASKITGAGIKDRSITHRDIASNTLKSRTMKNESIRGKDIRDGSLSNHDVGVLYAAVTDEGVLVRSSGNVSAARITGGADGRYAVDFNENITSCAFIATLSLSTTGVAEGQAGTGHMAGTTDTVRVNTVNSQGNPANKPFHLAVVC